MKKARFNWPGINDPVLDTSNGYGVALDGISDTYSDGPDETDLVEAIFKGSRISFTSMGGNEMKDCKLMFIALSEPDGSPLVPPVEYRLRYSRLIYLGVHLEQPDGDQLKVGFYEGWYDPTKFIGALSLVVPSSVIDDQE